MRADDSPAVVTAALPTRSEFFFGDGEREASARNLTENSRSGPSPRVGAGEDGRAARDLDLTESALRNWVEQARADRTKGKTGLTTAEREELARLRKENRILLEERDILKKATAFFAKQNR